MNRIKSISRRFKLIYILLSALSSIVNASPKANDCWVEFFENVDFKGKHFLVEGPAEVAYLNKENGENWESRISSLKVGPTATVTVYENRYFQLKTTEKPFPPALRNAWGISEQEVKEDSELIFNAKAVVHDLSDFKFEQKIKSIKVNCSA